MKKFLLIIVIILLVVSAIILITKPNKNSKYTGELLAGSVTPYVTFTKSDYEQAKTAGKIILLNFTTDGCASCRVEEQEAQAAFETLENPRVIGFQVNFKDEQTDADELALAKEFGVPYQQTKIILKDGKRVRKETVQWNKDQFIQALLQAEK